MKLRFSDSTFSTLLCGHGHKTDGHGRTRRTIFFVPSMNIPSPRCIPMRHEMNVSSKTLRNKLWEESKSMFISFNVGADSALQRRERILGLTVNHTL